MDDITDSTMARDPILASTLQASAKEVARGNRLAQAGMPSWGNPSACTDPGAFINKAAANLIQIRIEWASRKGVRVRRCPVPEPPEDQYIEMRSPTYRNRLQKQGGFGAIGCERRKSSVPFQVSEDPNIAEALLESNLKRMQKTTELSTEDVAEEIEECGFSSLSDRATPDTQGVYSCEEAIIEQQTGVCSGPETRPAQEDDTREDLRRISEDHVEAHSGSETRICAIPTLSLMYSTGFSPGRNPGSVLASALEMGQNAGPRASRSHDLRWVLLARNPRHFRGN